MYKNLDDMGIYDLRNYARAMGVHSPTTLRKQELIQKIEEITNGKLPDEHTNKKGRPPKHGAGDEYTLDLFMPNNLFKSDVPRYQTVASPCERFVKKNVLCENSNSVQTDNILFKGFYCPCQRSYGIAYFKGYLTDYSKENTIVLRPLAEKYMLRPGDYVVGVAKYLSDKNLYVATDITYINDKYPCDVQERQDYDDILPAYPTKQIVLSNGQSTDLATIDKICPVAKGARVVVNGIKEEAKHDFALHILDALSKGNNLRTLLISIDDSPEDIGNIIYRCSDVEVLCLSRLQSRAQYFEMVQMYIQNCINRLTCNQDIAVVIYDASKFVDAMAQSEVVSKGANPDTAHIIACDEFKSIFNSSRSCPNGSLTVIAFNVPQILQNSANCVINFKQSAYSNTDLHIDIDNSSTKNADKILSEPDFDFLVEIKQDGVDQRLQKLGSLLKNN